MAKITLTQAELQQCVLLGLVAFGYNLPHAAQVKFSTDFRRAEDGKPAKTEDGDYETVYEATIDVCLVNTPDAYEPGTASAILEKVAS